MKMTEMLEETTRLRDEAQAKDPKPIWYFGRTFEVEGVGKVWCGIMLATGASTFMRPHFRRTWELNGKRIAAAKLAAIVGE